MKGIIYKATNKQSGKSYIGQTTNSLKRRKSEHLKAKYRSYFQNALNKYGSTQFAWSVIEILKTPTHKALVKILNIREHHFIKYFRTYESGYNSTTGGGQWAISDATKKKISRTKKAQGLRGKKANWYGLRHTEKSKRKASASQKRRLKDPKVRAKCGRSIFGSKHYTSKKWIILTPKNKFLLIKGLNWYCKENKLSQGHMSRVADGLQKYHKGYLCWHVPCILYKQLSKN